MNRYRLIFVYIVLLVFTIIISIRCLQLRLNKQKITEQVNRAYPKITTKPFYQRGSIFGSEEQNRTYYATNLTANKVSLNLDNLRYRLSSYSFNKAYKKYLTFLAKNLSYNTRRLNYFLNDLKNNKTTIFLKEIANFQHNFEQFENDIYKDIYRHRLYYSEQKLNYQTIEEKVQKFKIPPSILTIVKNKGTYKLEFNFYRLNKITNFHNTFLLKKYIKNIILSIKKQVQSPYQTAENINADKIVAKSFSLKVKELTISHALLPLHRKILFQDALDSIKKIRQRTKDIEKIKFEYGVIKKQRIFKNKKYTDIKQLGIILSPSFPRLYPYNKVGNMIGFIQKSSKRPLMGLEKSLQKYLQTKKNQNGDDVYLSINSHIQSSAQTIIDKYQQEYQCKSIQILMANPYTGKIIAMAQTPNFSSNNRLLGQKFDNPIISYPFEPGSTIKPLLIVAALDKNYISTSDKIYCEDGYWKKYKLKDFHPIEGKASIEKIIVNSSNIGAGKIGYNLGAQKVHSIMQSFNFGEKPNQLELPHAEISSGILRPYKQWVPIDTTRASIGYSIAVTMPQMVSAYCSIANGGSKVYLSIVDKIKKTQGEIIKIPPKRKYNFLKKETTEFITSALIKVTENSEGTAPQAKITNYQVAGKTGTSSKKNNKNRASFIGYTPAWRPAFVLYVVVDEPPYKKRFGGSAAGPIFREIATKSLKILNILPYD